MNMVKPGIQTRRRKPKSSNNNNGSTSTKSKHSKHNATTTTTSINTGLIKEHNPCASESNIDYNLTTRKYSERKSLTTNVRSFV
jgi:hypothetical protein